MPRDLPRARTDAASVLPSGVAPVVAHPAGVRRSGQPTSAGVAQLVEQLIRNQQVSGSSPLAGSIRFNNLREVVIGLVRLGCAWDACWMRVQAVHGVAIRSRDEVAVDVGR